MIEYRTASFAQRDHAARGDEWGAWHTYGDRIQRSLFDDDGFLLAWETLEGDVADLVAFAKAGSDVTTHDAEAARRLSRLHSRQTTNLARAGVPE